MSSSPSNKRACVKRGHVLTCYVDGRKRFRVIPTNNEEEPQPPMRTTSRRRKAASAPVSAVAPTIRRR